MKTHHAGSYEELKAGIGIELGATEPVQITQEQIDKFADATGDDQWVHVDPERAKESQFGSTIAHGYLTIALIPTLMQELLITSNSRMTVNYEIEKMRFGEPVLVNDSLQLRAKILEVKQLRQITRMRMETILDIVGKPKPAVKGNISVLYYFE
jgi:acyl dehydratase